MLYKISLQLVLFSVVALGFVAACGLSLVGASNSYSLVACGLLIAVGSLVAAHRLWGMWASVVVTHGLSCCRSQALEHSPMDGTHSSVTLQMWDAPGAGIKPKSPALAGGPLT